MSARDDVLYRGNEKGRIAWDRVRREIRQARIDSGRSQAVAARYAGIDQATWSRIENDQLQRVDFETLGRMAAAVGLDLTVNLYPAPRRLHDTPQLELFADVRFVHGPDWDWLTEVHIGLPPDQRAWDLAGRHRVTKLEVRIDADCAFTNCQAVVRRVEGKRVADGDPRVILALRDSRSNRRAVEEAMDTLRLAFPVDGRTGLAALRRGEDPGGNVLLMVDWHRTERLALARPSAPPPSVRR